MQNPFLKHPIKNKETYWQHWKCAVKIGLEAYFISIIIFIHAFFPFVFENTASERLKKLHEKVERRKRECQK